MRSATKPESKKLPKSVNLRIAKILCYSRGSLSVASRLREKGKSGQEFQCTLSFDEVFLIINIIIIIIIVILK